MKRAAAALTPKAIVASAVQSTNSPDRGLPAPAGSRQPLRRRAACYLSATDRYRRTAQVRHHRVPVEHPRGVGAERRGP